MVKVFRALLQAANKPIRAHLRGSFIDSLRITVQGGHGGNGVPKYGGVGGQGGCVYFVAKDGIELKQVEQKYRAKRISASAGEDSSKMRILGRRGMDERVEVPVGVQVLDEHDKIIGDLNEENSVCLAAGGGMGGCSGTNFIGRPGDHKTIKLDLKLIADVGLVGFPNAGKSTFLGAISRAKPRIASYPFTTVRPQLGVVDYRDLRTITIADLPGLIEGAHANKGLGHRFLKHIERTRLLLFVVDINGFQLSPMHPERSCLETLYALNKEIEFYNPQLLEKPCVLLINKMDKELAMKKFYDNLPILQHLEDGLNSCPMELRPTKLLNIQRIIPISAKTKSRIDQVKKQLRAVLDEEAERKMLENQENLQDKLRIRVNERGPKIT